MTIKVTHSRKLFAFENVENTECVRKTELAARLSVYQKDRETEREREEEEREYIVDLIVE